MTEISAIELDHCREVALQKGGLFEFTSRYLPASRFEEYLSLYAVVTLVRAIPFSAVDDSVKWTQLKWWMEELSAESVSQSRHPVLKALVSSGASAKFEAGKLQRLVTDAFMCVDVVPCSDTACLFERLSATGTTVLELELELDKVVIDSPSLNYLGAASGLYDVLYGFCSGEIASFQQIPMNYLAKQDLGVTELQLEKNRVALATIMESLAKTALEWFEKGMAGLNDSKAKHLQLSLAMQRKRLKVINQDAITFLENRPPFGPSDAWFAWRFLRRLN